MKKRSYFLSFFFLFFFAINVSALEECTTSEQKRLKELASNVEFKYDYKIEEVSFTGSDEGLYKEVFYSIKALNLTEEIFVNVVNDEENRKFTNKEPVVSNFLNGEAVRLEIVAYTKNLCAGRVLLTKTIRLPYFNTYSLREECKLYPAFKYCKESLDLSISEEEFINELEKYKSNLSSKPNSNPAQQENFFKKYSFCLYIVLGLVVVGSIILVHEKKKKKKDRDL